MHISGLHHITAISGGPQTNYDFNSELLGLRLVKKTVNFDDPKTWHLYYGDATGSPGTLLTFFPFEHASQGRAGTGMASRIGFAIPEKSFDWWNDHIADNVERIYPPASRFGSPVVKVVDRQYFKSIYFQEPGGVLLEIATDPPGMLTDETDVTLGTGLKLPPWFEDNREHIEKQLPELRTK